MTYGDLWASPGIEQNKQRDDDSQQDAVLKANTEGDEESSQPRQQVHLYNATDFAA